MSEDHAADYLAPIHPGEVLLEDFLKPMGVTEYRLAKAMDVPARRINEIVHGKRAITADTALRLGKAFGMEAQFWLNLQSRYDMDRALDRISVDIETRVKRLAETA